jgi:hypothetical protein
MNDTITIEAVNVNSADNGFDNSVVIRMNPLNAAMNPLSQMALREQKIDLSELKDLMQETLTLLQRTQAGPLQVDLGAEETRPGDLRAQFAPRVAQENRLYTGRGDERTIIV